MILTRLYFALILFYDLEKKKKNHKIKTKNDQQPLKILYLLLFRFSVTNTDSTPTFIGV